VDLLQ
jgi:hypothetical protein